MLVEKIGADGKPELDANGKPIMVDDGKVKEEKPLTQDAFDREYRLRKEAEEKLAKSEKEKVDLVERTKPPVSEDISTEKKYGFKPDGSIIFPQTEEEWDDLAIERPTLHTDLRNTWYQQRNQQSEKFKQSAVKVATEILPDMYKKDANGNVLKTAQGHPVPDETSELYKRYAEIADSIGPVLFNSPAGPELVALKLQRVIEEEKGNSLQKQAEIEMSEAEKKRQIRVKDGQTAPPGATPPPAKKYDVKFNSEYERKAAEEKVARGIYSSLEDYCKTRDGVNVIPYNRGV